MIIDKKQWELRAMRWTFRRKKLSRLMYAHLLLSIPLLIWLIRLDTNTYEITWVGSLILNGSFIFAVLVMLSHFSLEKERKQLISSYDMIEMLEEPKDQWGNTAKSKQGVAE